MKKRIKHKSKYGKEIWQYVQEKKKFLKKEQKRIFERK